MKIKKFVSPSILLSLSQTLLSLILLSLGVQLPRGAVLLGVFIRGAGIQRTNIPEEIKTSANYISQWSTSPFCSFPSFPHKQL
jgi:hypothetical protein